MKHPSPIPAGFRQLPAYDKPIFNSLIGPLWARPVGEDGIDYGFVLELRHCNPQEVAHGGLLASFADIVLTGGTNYVAKLSRFVVTVSLATDFLACGLRRVPWAGLPVIVTLTVPISVLESRLSWVVFVGTLLLFVMLLATEQTGRVLAWGRSVAGGGERIDSLDQVVNGSTVRGAAARIGVLAAAGAMVLPAFVPVSSGLFKGGNGAGQGHGRNGSVTLRNPIVDLRRDLLTFLQNSVREPALQYQDLKVKYYAALRIKDRVLALIDEVGRDAFIVSLRKSLEDVAAEARRRIAAIPDGTYRVNFFTDSTLRENVLIKYPCAITVRGENMTIDWRGAAPQFLNRAFNTTLASGKCGMNQALLGFLWPDLPRGISIMNSIDVLTDQGSCVHPTDDAPLGQSLQGTFKTFGVVQALFPKMTFSCPEKFGSIIAPWFNQINTFLFGGVTQHGQFVGNVCADLNGMGGGARAYRDGEPAMAPFFAAMADLGEQEIIEEDVPFLQLISKRIKRDNQGFGKYRGGMGYEIAVAAKGTPMWGFATVSSGSKFPAVPGLFGGYGCPALPLAKIKGTNVFETLRERPELFAFDFEQLLNEQPFPDAQYSTHHMGMGFELADEGEVYMICQGSGGGYGDVLERDPNARHSGMHRTESIDYALILDGEIDMLLDDSETHLKTGDIVIMQGTYHAWANRTNKTCMMAFILVGATVPWKK